MLFTWLLNLYFFIVANINNFLTLENWISYIVYNFFKIRNLISNVDLLGRYNFLNVDLVLIGDVLVVLLPDICSTT